MSCNYFYKKNTATNVEQKSAMQNQKFMIKYTIFKMEEK